MKRGVKQGFVEGRKGGREGGELVEGRERGRERVGGGGAEERGEFGGVEGREREG